jgi:D-alanine-D-alanine ligase-like ATP-grasp enzyme
MNIEQPIFPKSVEASHIEQASKFPNTLTEAQEEQLKNIFARAFEDLSLSKA